MFGCTKLTQMVVTPPPPPPPPPLLKNTLTHLTVGHYKSDTAGNIGDSIQGYLNGICSAEREIHRQLMLRMIDREHQHVNSCGRVRVCIRPSVGDSYANSAIFTLEG